jgi:glutaminyl-peptide cyclotransferase
MFQIRILLMALVTLGAVSCNTSSSKSRRPVSKITVVSSASTLNFGSNFEIQIESKTDKGSIDSVYVYLGSTLLKASDQSKFSIQVEKNKFIGNQNIKVIAKTTKGTEGTNFKPVFIASDKIPQKLEFELVEQLPHNPKYFTQGLEFVDNTLYEGTGEYGTSAIYAYNPKTGKVSKEKGIDKQYFGEGITILNGKIYQLTYQNKKGFVRDLSTLEKIREFGFDSAEGWGLTNDGNNLIMSDGTAFLTYLNPSDFTVVKRIEVVSDQQAITNLNELEYVDGYIFANIWQTNYIIQIEAETGRVVGVATLNNFQSIAASKSSRIDVLNGIAYHRSEDAFYITGKLWPVLFKTKLKK